MAVLKIKRVHQYINLLAPYEILIDGVKVGDIKNEETKEFDLTEGKHTIMAKIDWCSSPEIIVEIGKNEVVMLEVNAFKIRLAWIWAIVITGLNLLLIGSLTTYTNITTIILIIAIAYIPIVYYLTLKRSAYLTWKKIEVPSNK
jgi:hypothetical protein